MKRIFLIILLPYFVWSQNGDPNQPNSETDTFNYDCQNVNEWLFDPSSAAFLDTIADTIYPRGRILLDLAYEHLYVDAANVADLIADNVDVSFTQTQISNSFLSDNEYTIRYQQNYKGLKVQGGGYVAAFRTQKEPDDPVGPCDFAYGLSPFIITGLDLNIVPNIQINQLASILANEEGFSSPLDIEIHSQELIIAHNPEFSCQAFLAYEVLYYALDARKGLINALTGEVVVTRPGYILCGAQTQDYGYQQLQCFQEPSGGLSLQTPNTAIRTYDFSGLRLFSDQTTAGVSRNDYQSNRIPVTPNSNWGNESTEGVYQAHFVTPKVVSSFTPILQTLGIGLGIVNVGADAIGDNAAFFEFSTNINTYIGFGQTSNGDSWATFDVVGHELGHAIINRFIKFSNHVNGSLHEGFADIFGVYAEYKHYGVVDWNMGNEIPKTLRDLANPDPNYDCYSDVRNEKSSHKRGIPLGYLFYLLSEGDASLGIPSLGIESAMSIMLETLKSLGSESDYTDVREEMIKITESNFDLCSDESIAIRRAWCQICVGPAPFCSFGCDFHLDGPTFICEEDDYLQICLGGNYNPVIQTRWRIIAKNGLNWQAIGNQTGNTVTGGSCLTITDLPKYPYYPQEAVIKFYSPTLGSESIIRKRIVLLDCDNDDPTCEDYYNISPLIAEQVEILGQSTLKTYEGASAASYFRLFNIYGQLLYEGPDNPSRSSDVINAHQGIAILVSYDIKGRIIKSTKLLY
jgi:hypothetical protein